MLVASWLVPVGWCNWLVQLVDASGLVPVGWCHLVSAIGWC